MLSEVRLKEVDDMSHRNGRPVDWRIAGQHVAERYHSNGVASRRHDMASRQQVLCHVANMFVWTTSKSSEGHFEDGGIAHRGVEPEPSADVQITD